MNWFPKNGPPMPWAWPLPIEKSKEYIDQIDPRREHIGIPLFFYVDATGRHLWPQPMRHTDD